MIKFEHRHASEIAMACINKKSFADQIELIRKVRAVVPFNELRVGWSFWIDIDVTELNEWQSALRSMRYFNSVYKAKFMAFKHRGDARKSGFKYLEIVRIV